MDSEIMNKLRFDIEYFTIEFLYVREDNGITYHHLTDSITHNSLLGYKNGSFKYSLFNFNVE